MTIELTPPWRDLTFMSPLSEQRAARLVDFVAADLNGTVLDLGCGWAELLLRVVAAAPESSGIGIDLDAPAIEHGRSLAAERGLSDRATLHAGDSGEVMPDHVDAVICVGATHAWAPPAGAELEPLHYDAALRRIRALVPRGSRVVYGDGIWSTPPQPATIAALGSRDDELVSLGELVDIAVGAGFAAYAVHEASLDEWDAFESGYSACYARWLAEHPADHPDAAEVRGRVRRQRDGYLRGYRGVMGLAYLELVAV